MLYRVSKELISLCLAKAIKKLPADTNQKAKAIVDALTSEDKETTPTSQEDIIKAAAAALGRKGGLKGGIARAKPLPLKDVLKSLKRLLLRDGEVNRISMDLQKTIQAE